MNRLISPYSPTPHFRRLGPLTAVALITAGSGCQTVNGVVYGFERDVDTVVAAIDRATTDFLPASGPSPRQHELTHVDFPDTPDRFAGHTRFGKPHQ